MASPYAPPMGAPGAAGNGMPVEYTSYPGYGGAPGTMLPMGAGSPNLGAQPPAMGAAMPPPYMGASAPAQPYNSQAFYTGGAGLASGGQGVGAASASMLNPAGPSPSPSMSMGLAPGAMAQAGSYGNLGTLPGGIDSNVAAQVGLAYGAQAFIAGQRYLNQNVNRYVNIPHLKYYFAVSNAYVVKKIQLILFPFRNKDNNAPDLYIPAMAFLTFMLLVGVALGQRSSFTPEVLGLTSSKAMAVVIVEILSIKAGCYIFNIPGEIVLLDLLAYMGYKFVGMILSILSDLLFGTYIYAFAYIYTNVALAFFLIRTLRHNLYIGDGAPTDAVVKRRRNYFLLAIAGSQLVTSYFLTRY